MIKKFTIEFIFLAILFPSIFLLYNVDIGLYNFFYNFDNTQHNIYLKNFFQNITALGDSKWYFIISIFAFLFFYLIKKNTFLNYYKKDLQALSYFSFFLFSSLIVSGTITQLLKHIIGRSRPNHMLSDNNIVFDFFNFSSDFHSFPSGHTSTIFTVALLLVFFIPKLKYFFLLLAGIVAFSRVVVGAHFLTDILGGIVIAFISVKFTKLIQEKYYIIKFSSKIESFFKNKIVLSLTICFFLIIFITIGPAIDIYFSSIFYYGGEQFLLQSFYNITIIFRKIILPLIVIYILILPIISIFLPIKKIYANYEFKKRDLLFLWGSVIFNLLVIVNLLLKNFWGRARPGDIIQFDGKEMFTPWFKVSDACITNCSFVSGDASVGFSLIVLFFITKNIVFFWTSLIFGFSIGLVRIMEGGHFLSDIIMSLILVYLCYFFQKKFFYKKNV